tara:strand:- start:6 stop:590 length:585 start_codon:yes stop_codon:yes gene_type:complete
MNDERATSGHTRRRAKPLDRNRLEELALAYVARFATSAGKLRTYLRRKLHERGFVDGEEPDIETLISSFVDKGYVDDEAYGRAKANDLVARGYGGRRVEQTLRSAGIAEDLREVLQPDEAHMRQAVVVLARKRRFGPFGRLGEASAEDARKLREKQLAAVVRAGHDFHMARRVIEASTVEELEEWVTEASDELG